MNEGKATMKRKHLMFCAGLLILLILVLGISSASAALTDEQIAAIKARGEANLTEEERLALLNCNISEDKIPTDMSLGDEVSVSVVDGKRRIMLSKASFKMKFLSAGTHSKGETFGKKQLEQDITITYSEQVNGYTPPAQNCEFRLDGSYLQIADDAVLIQENNSGWFTETSGSNSILMINDSCTIYAGSVSLQAGVPVLILETDGRLHGFYAGNGTTGSQLVLGDKLNIHRGIQSGHILTYDFGPTFALPPFAMGWANGAVSTGFKGTLTIHLDLDWDVTWYGGIEVIVRENSVEIKYPQITAEVFNDTPFTGVSYPICVISEEIADVLSIEGGVYFHAEGYGRGTTVVSTNLKEGAGVTFLFAYGVFTVDEAHWVHDANFDIQSSDQRGEVYFGYEYGTDYMVENMVGMGLSYDGGLVLEGDASYGHVYPGDPNKEKFWHECENGQCVSGDAHMRLGPLSVNALILGYSAPLYSVGQKDFDPFKYYYSSKTFGDSSMTSPCPHKGYRLNTNVIRSDTGEPISGASVSYTPVVDHYDGATSATTDDNGNAVLYAPADSEITVTASKTSTFDPQIIVTASKTLTKKDAVEDLALTIDIPVKTVHFKNITSETPEQWPEDIPFTPFDSENVLLPSTIPELSGRKFIGWNTKEDGTGTFYAPGTMLTSDDDVTLWAQWDTVENSWYVIYNAHGGTKAPGPQIILLGKDAVLTQEPAESPSMIFLGWSTDRDAVTPEYQPGDTLPYVEGRDYVVLYALWEIDPVSRPVIVTFNANGGQLDNVPKRITIARGAWMRLPLQQPSWDAQHDFLGWATDPNATEPKWHPGNVDLFIQDTTLYAVWNAHYKVIEGAGSVWTKGSGKTQRFVADGDVKLFKELRIDGASFNAGVDISSGSTIADISAKAMETLSVGKHTVTFVYVDGEASADFSVQKILPPTGDAGYPALWLILIALGTAALLLGILPYSAKRK